MCTAHFLPRIPLWVPRRPATSSPPPPLGPTSRVGRALKRGHASACQNLWKRGHLIRTPGSKLGSCAGAAPVMHSDKTKREYRDAIASALAARPLASHARILRVCGCSSRMNVKEEDGRSRLRLGMMNTYCANKMGQEEVVVLATFTAG